jgi:hypothetical protein
MIVTELTLIGAALLAPLSIGASIRGALGLRPAPPVVFLAAALGTVLLGPLADLVMRAMEQLLPDLSLGVVPMLHQIIKQLSPLLAWPVFALLPGIAEELMFRATSASPCPRSVSRRSTSIRTTSRASCRSGSSWPGSARVAGRS